MKKLILKVCSEAFSRFSAVNLIMTAVESGVSVVLGGQWGDEGKGKLVDILAQNADIVARCQV